MGSDDSGRSFPFFVVFLRLSSLFFVFFFRFSFSAFLFSFFFSVFLLVSERTRGNDCNLLQKWGISLRPRLHRPRAKLPDKLSQQVGEVPGKLGSGLVVFLWLVGGVPSRGLLTGTRRDGTPPPVRSRGVLDAGGPKNLGTPRDRTPVLAGPLALADKQPPEGPVH